MKPTLRLLTLFAVLMLGMAPRPAQAAPQPATIRLTAWVSTHTPEQNANVFVFAQVKRDGKGRAGFPVTFTWTFKSGEQSCSGKTDNRGIAFCKLSTATEPYGTKVLIEASLTVDRKSYTATTSFTPTRADSTAPAAVPTPLPTPPKRK